MRIPSAPAGIRATLQGAARRLAPVRPPRPAISVVVPFAGSAEDARATVAALGRLALADGDEVVLVDNSAGGVAAAHASPAVRVVRAAGRASSYHARNAGARATANPWLLFLDSDCTPPPDLLDRFFDAPVDDGVGAIAGGVAGEAGQDGVVSRYARARRHLDQELNIANPYRPMAVTANLLVRRRAFDAIGG